MLNEFYIVSINKRVTGNAMRSSSVRMNPETTSSSEESYSASTGRRLWYFAARRLAENPPLRAALRPTQIISSDWARALVCDDARDQRFNVQAFALVHFLVEQRLR